MVCRHERANERSSVRYWDVPPFRWTPRVDKSIPRLVEVAFITATLFFYCYWNRHSSKDADVSVAANDKNLWSRFYRRNGERTLFMPRKRTIMCRQFSYKVFRCVLRYIYVCICVYIYMFIYIYMYICIYVFASQSALAINAGYGAPCYRAVKSSHEQHSLIYNRIGRDSIVTISRFHWAFECKL